MKLIAVTLGVVVIVGVLVTSVAQTQQNAFAQNCAGRIIANDRILTSAGHIFVETAGHIDTSTYGLIGSYLP